MTEKKTQAKKQAKESVKKQPAKKEEKFTLLELVEACDEKASRIALELSRAGLLKQFEYELQTNEAIKPTLTQKQFDKIIKGE